MIEEERVIEARKRIIEEGFRRAINPLGIGDVVRIKIGDNDPETVIIVERGSGGRFVGKHFAVSADTPVGKALIGKKTGEEIVAIMPSGNKVSIKVIEKKEEEG